MFIQLLTAIGAVIGCIVALMSVDAQKWEKEVQSSWVMPFTAGGFIYIATVSILPDLLKRSSFWLTIVEVLAMSAGVIAMYWIGFLEHQNYEDVFAVFKKLI
jgi:zinc transporter 7